MAFLFFNAFDFIYQKKKGLCKLFVMGGIIYYLKNLCCTMTIKH